MEKNPGFVRNAVIQLDFGAIITPIIKLGQSSIGNQNFINYLEKNSWERCKFRDRCIDAVLDFDGLSCEICPLRDKQENFRFVTYEKEMDEARKCTQLLNFIFQT